MICFTTLPSIGAGKILVLVSDCFSLHSSLPISVILFSHLQNQTDVPKLLYIWLSFLKEQPKAFLFHKTGSKVVDPELHEHYKRFKTAKCEEQSICKVPATAPGFPLSHSVKHKQPSLNGNSLHYSLMKGKGKIICMNVHNQLVQGELDCSWDVCCTHWTREQGNPR